MRITVHYEKTVFQIDSANDDNGWRAEIRAIQHEYLVTMSMPGCMPDDQFSGSVEHIVDYVLDTEDTLEPDDSLRFQIFADEQSLYGEWLFVTNPGWILEGTTDHEALETYRNWSWD